MGLAKMSESIPKMSAHKMIILKRRLDGRDNETGKTKDRVGNTDNTQNIRNGEEPEGRFLEAFIYCPGVDIEYEHLAFSTSRPCIDKTLR